MAEKHDHPAHAQSSPDVEEDMSVGQYIATRIPSLVPPMNPAPNPFKALTLLNRQQWMFFLVRLYPAHDSEHLQT
jgi:SHS family lactate transporter-like MFS transporter